MKFGLIVIGDEILSGRRRDRHFPFFRELLQEHGHALHWLQVLPDEPELLTARLRQTMAEGLPVFSCGGIGATPDDHTRQCAARAGDVPLVRNPQAEALIEERFGEAARPHRVRMADLPQGAGLIPNPVNQVPGFSFRNHHFLPGFPEMAHPMAEWVLGHHYGDAAHPEVERSLRVFDVSENELMPLMQRLDAAWPGLKLFSLPRRGKENFVELGFRGRQEEVERAFAELRAALEATNQDYEVMPG
jgi:molybdopterin-biosynthesis enzyme MoeA-like protein